MTYYSRLCTDGTLNFEYKLHGLPGTLLGPMFSLGKQHTSWAGFLAYIDTRSESEQLPNISVLPGLLPVKQKLLHCFVVKIK